MCYGSKQLSQPLRAQPRSLLTGLQADLMRFMTTAWDADHRLRQQAGLTCAPNMQMGAMLAEYRLALAMAGVRSEGWPRQQAELQCSILKSDGFLQPARGLWCPWHGFAQQQASLNRLWPWAAHDRHPETATKASKASCTVLYRHHLDHEALWACPRSRHLPAR